MAALPEERPRCFDLHDFVSMETMPTFAGWRWIRPLEGGPFIHSPIMLEPW
jgi:hypothetical protein